MLNFSMYQSGIGFKCPYSNPSVKALNPVNRLNAIFVSWYIVSQNPLFYLIGT
jgi:hypothetical protein